MPLLLRDACHEHRHSGEHGHSGGAVLPASDRIVSTNLVRAAAVTPRLVGNRYGGWPRRDVTDGRGALNAESFRMTPESLSSAGPHRLSNSARRPFPPSLSLRLLRTDPGRARAAASAEHRRH
jgi:hypothetical protein